MKRIIIAINIVAFVGGCNSPKDPIEYNNLAEKQEYKDVISEMRTLLYKNE